jgi:hypothetical protein
MPQTVSDALSDVLRMAIENLSSSRSPSRLQLLRAPTGTHKTQSLLQALLHGPAADRRAVYLTSTAYRHVRSNLKHAGARLEKWKGHYDQRHDCFVLRWPFLNSSSMRSWAAERRLLVVHYRHLANAAFWSVTREDRDYGLLSRREVVVLDEDPLDWIYPVRTASLRLAHAFGRMASLDDPSNSIDPILRELEVPDRDLFAHELREIGKQLVALRTSGRALPPGEVGLWSEQKVRDALKRALVLWGLHKHPRPPLQRTLVMLVAASLMGRAVVCRPWLPHRLDVYASPDMRGWSGALARPFLCVVAGATIDDRDYLEARRAPVPPVEDTHSVFHGASLHFETFEGLDKPTSAVAHAVPAPTPKTRGPFTRHADRAGGKHLRVLMRRQLSCLLNGILHRDARATIAVVATSDFLRRRYGVPQEWLAEYRDKFQERSGWEDCRACATRHLRMELGRAPDLGWEQLRVEYAQGLEGRNDLSKVDWLILIGLPYVRRPCSSEFEVWKDLSINVLVQAVGRLRLRERGAEKPATVVGWGAPVEDRRIVTELGMPTGTCHADFDSLLGSLETLLPARGRGRAPEARLLPALALDKGVDMSRRMAKESASSPTTGVASPRPGTLISSTISAYVWGSTCESSLGSSPISRAVTELRIRASSPT